MLADQLGLSKKQLNRRVRLTRDFMTAFRADGEEVWGDFDADAVFAAMDTVERYRAAHARSLARVNAGLRYYVKKAGMGQPDVTQRLKRFSAIVDELQGPACSSQLWRT